MEAGSNILTSEEFNNTSYNVMNRIIRGIKDNDYPIYIGEDLINSYKDDTYSNLEKDKYYYVKDYFRFGHAIALDSADYEEICKDCSSRFIELNDAYGGFSYFEDYKTLEDISPQIKDELSKVFEEKQIIECNNNKNIYYLLDELAFKIRFEDVFDVLSEINNLEPMTIDFTKPYILGDKNTANGYFTDMRIKPALRPLLPDGWNVYDFRHGDDGDICTLEPQVNINHAGHFITNEAITFLKPYFSIDEDFDYDFVDKENDLELE